jgi:hypothetical protein
MLDVSGYPPGAWVTGDGFVLFDTSSGALDVRYASPTDVSGVVLLNGIPGAEDSPWRLVCPPGADCMEFFVVPGSPPPVSSTPPFMILIFAVALAALVACVLKEVV